MKGDTELYKLNFKLELLYQPNSNFPLYKKLGEDYKFYDTNIKKDEFESFVSLDVAQIEYIVKNILHGDISYRIDEECEDWYDRAKTYLGCNGYEVSFLPLYILLGLKIIGFDDDLSEKFVKQYIKNKEENTLNISDEEIIENIEKYSRQKKYYIIENEKDIIKEIVFLQSVFEAKITDKIGFSLKNYDQKYIQVCRNSIAIKNYRGNKNLKESENINYTLNAFKHLQMKNAKKALIEIGKKNMDTNIIDYRFINSVIDNQCDIIQKIIKLTSRR